jgi:translation elongation factor EF-1beta
MNLISISSFFSVFGEVNLNIENDFSRKDSLEIAQQQLREFRDKNGRLPTSKDGKIHSIWRAAKRSVWKDLGIETWNDLFIITFGVSAIERYKYVGKKGLERAIKEIKDYKKKMKKNPSVPEMDSIYRAIKKGNWKKYGINCWNDILYNAIGEVNVERKDYKGKKGLEKAIKELKTFKDKTGQFPTTKNQGMWNIAYAVRQGEWKQFGISNWYDLLKIVFKDIKIERDKYKGKEGLDNAVQALRDFEKSSGRKPTSKDVGMRNIQNAIWRGVWKELGVNYWNDLFKVAFGVNNVRRSRSKYKGKEALNRAVQTLKDFEKNMVRKPTSKDVGMRNIQNTIRRGIWKEYGVSFWNDLFKIAFGVSNVRRKRSKYSGEEGLNRAVQDLRNFKIKYNKNPTTMDNEMRRIAGAIYRGVWKDLNIHSWMDLFNIAFYEENKDG